MEWEQERGGAVIRGRTQEGCQAWVRGKHTSQQWLPGFHPPDSSAVQQWAALIWLDNSIMKHWTAIHKDVQTSLMLSSVNYKSSPSFIRKELKLSLLTNILHHRFKGHKWQTISSTLWPTLASQQVKQILSQHTNPTPTYVKLYYR